MLYFSTNGSEAAVSLRTAVFRGLAVDGGLFLPETIPLLPHSFFDALPRLSFHEICISVARPFLSPDISESELDRIVTEAINFDAPLVKFSDAIHCLELFHGPTLAFKDFGARFMARLMSHLLQDSSTNLTVLVATSGDTGSAVAHGFYRVPGIRVVLLYPSGKVSEIQEKQLTTLGENITALEILGTFDDCQKMVKEAFLDPVLTSKMQLTSANSINIARLIPQCFYYFRAVSQLGPVSNEILISVPSGNFGNLTAGLIAQRMGLPVAKFIAATNQNAVVPEYLNTGIFHPRPSVHTLSNAMDVGNPSNFARILALFQNDLAAIRKVMHGSAFSDEETRKAIAEIKSRYNYFAEPHGAVGYLGLKASPHPQQTGIFFETAHPAKFPEVVEEVTGLQIPLPPALHECMKRTKKSVVISNRYQDLKDFLLQLS